MTIRSTDIEFSVSGQVYGRRADFIAEVETAGTDLVGLDITRVRDGFKMPDPWRFLKRVGQFDFVVENALFG